jgi:cytochrome P450
LRPFYEALKDERRDILSGVMRYLNEWLVFKAPPEHTRLRKMMNVVFSLQLIQSREVAIRKTVAQLLEAVDPSHEVDFMEKVAVLLPAYVILDMMGLPREDFAFVHWHIAFRRRQVQKSQRWCRSHVFLFPRRDCTKAHFSWRRCHHRHGERQGCEWRVERG